jgi:hypothetical protein
MVIQFIVIDEVSFGRVRQASGLGFVIRYRSEPEVPGDPFLLVWVSTE